MLAWLRENKKGDIMKKIVLYSLMGKMLSACVGFVEGRSKNGKRTYDLYVVHPAITISGYTSQI